jgi:hypothetical protein
MITQERLKELFNYDPVTGWFTNRFSRGRARVGKRAGTYNFGLYRRIVIDYEKHYEHHLAWFYVYGEYPKEIDHIDGDPSNNRISNLRPCDRSQNNFNSLRPTGESGLRGAYLDKRSLTWYSHIQLGGQVKHLGTFPSARAAHEAFMQAVELHHGEFAYHNRNLSDRSL